MRHVSLVAAIVAVAFTAGLTAQTAATKKPPVTDGHWDVASINGADPATMMGASMALVFKGDTYQQLTGGKVSEEGALKFDMTKTPAEIDLIIKTGADAGKTQLGLVAVKGDVMSLTLGLPAAAERPASLAAGPLVVIANRKKPGSE